MIKSPSDTTIYAPGLNRSPVNGNVNVCTVGRESSRPLQINCVDHDQVQISNPGDFHNELRNDSDMINKISEFLGNIRLDTERRIESMEQQAMPTIGNQPQMQQQPVPGTSARVVIDEQELGEVGGNPQQAVMTNKERSRDCRENDSRCRKVLGCSGQTQW